MVKVKIVKKKKTTFDRFESDRHIRLDVRLNLKFNREAGEDPEVSIVESEESLEELLEHQKLVMDPTIKQDTYFPVFTSRNSSSIMSLNWIVF
jgi:hypothetical protein